jgi:hypothetical protein
MSHPSEILQVGIHDIFEENNAIRYAVYGTSKDFLRMFTVNKRTFVRAEKDDKLINVTCSKIQEIPRHLNTSTKNMDEVRYRTYISFNDRLSVNMLKIHIYLLCEAINHQLRIDCIVHRSIRISHDPIQANVK